MALMPLDHLGNHPTQCRWCQSPYVIVTHPKTMPRAAYVVMCIKCDVPMGEVAPPWLSRLTEEL